MEPDRIISHYRVLEKLGGGGMGVVFKAEDTRLRRTVALKFLPPELTCDAEARERLVREAQAASALQHPNICVVHDIDQAADGQLFLVMEFLEGESLKTKIDRGPLPVDQAVDVAIQISGGLAKAHEHGIVHRDIKPANIIMTGDGLAKVVDFGLARLSGRSVVTREGSTLGTLAYMSPEQTRGETVDHRSDVWSLGAVLYEMIVGTMPFTGDYENVVAYEIANLEPKPVTSLRTGVPMELERIIGKAMAKSPDERYQHADEMLADLKRLARQTEHGMTAPRTQPVQSGSADAGHHSRAGRNRLLLYVSALVVILAGVYVLRPVFFDEILVSEPKPVAVVAFENQTGDPSLDYLRAAIPNLLITSLEQSKYLRVMTWERMSDLLKQLGRKDVTLVDKELGFELCRREGIHAIVVGSFVKAGETFATDVKVLDVDTKGLLKTASARGDGVQSILQAQIDDLSREIARGVGLSQRKVESTQGQIAEVTTSSMEAYNLFLRGRAEFDMVDYVESKGFLEKAVALDSNFALAYLYLSRASGSMFDVPLAVNAISRAMALAPRAPEKERLLIEARYAELVERNNAKRLALLEELVRKFPQDKRFHHDLGVAYFASGGRIPESQRELEKAIELDPTFSPPTNQLAYLYKELGLYDKALETLKRYVALAPGDANPYDSMGELLLCMGRTEESIASYQEAIRIEPAFLGARRGLAYVLMLKEDYPGVLTVNQKAMASAPTLGVRIEALSWRLMYLLWMGREKERARLLEETARQVEGLSSLFSIPIRWMLALDAIRKGKSAQARTAIASFDEGRAQNSPLVPVSRGAMNDFLYFTLHLRVGRLDSARARLDHLWAALPAAEEMKSTYRMIAGMSEAELLLAEGNPDSAIAVYRATPVIHPTNSIGWRAAFYNVPPLRDMVPRAFQRKGELDSAITEYERLMRIDPATRDRRWIHPLYHYRLALLCQRTGRTDKAIAEYRRFLEIWKDADSDQPELRDARVQLAKLERARR